MDVPSRTGAAAGKVTCPQDTFPGRVRKIGHHPPGRHSRMLPGLMGNDVERDFYRRLLDLGGQDEIEPLLDQALALIVEVTGARIGYLELHEDDGDRAEPRFWRGHNCTPATLGEIRASISHGIIAQAIADGRTIETPSALS